MKAFLTKSVSGLCIAAAAFIATPADAQKANDTFRVAINDPFTALDSYYGVSDEGGNFNRASAGTLLKYNEHKGEFVGELITAWRRIDEKTLEFDLRDDVFFHSGNKFTAEDVKYTIDFLKDPKSKIRFIDRFTWIKDVQILSPTKVRYTSHVAQSTDISIVAYQQFMYDSAIHKTLAVPQEYGRVSGSGTGPYRLISVDRVDGIKMERFEKMAPTPHLRAPIKRVHGIWMPDKQTQVAQLITGGVDLLTNVAPDTANNLVSHTGVVSTTAHPSKQLLYITFDAAGRSDNKIMTNELVRKAIVMAIDREAIIKNFIAGADMAERPKSICFNSTLGCKPTTQPLPYDPAAAKKLLADAGYPNGIDIKLNVFLPVQYLGVAISGELRKVGIRASVEGLPQQTYAKKRADGDLTTFLGVYPVSGLPDVANMLDVFFGADRDYVKDPIFQKTMADGLAEFDLAKRTALYTPALDLLNEKAYMLPISEQPTLFAHSKEVKIAPSLYSAGSTRISDYMWQ